jgi:cytochrome c-type biogenesis protein
MNLAVAFFAGLLTFFTPCVFPLIPSYLSYITGFSVEELSKGDRKEVLNRSVIGSLSFILGFTFIFVLLGLSASMLGSLAYSFQNILRVTGGVLIAIFGLTLTGLLDLKFLNIEKRFQPAQGSKGYYGAFLFGMTFAAGWVPCVGPVLSSILLLAASEGSRFYGGMLLSFYCLGLGLPLFLSAVAFNYYLTFFKKAIKYIDIIEKVGGVILILVGLLLITDNLTLMTMYIDKIIK